MVFVVTNTVSRTFLISPILVEARIGRGGDLISKGYLGTRLKYKDRPHEIMSWSWFIYCVHVCTHTHVHTHTHTHTHTTHTHQYNNLTIKSNSSLIGPAASEVPNGVPPGEGEEDCTNV